MSRQAGRRLTVVLMGIDWRNCAASMLTLTYPREWPADPGTWRRHLDRFRGRLDRRYGRRVAGAVWVKEFQRRGAPHYHLIVFWRGPAPELADMIAFVSRAWWESCGQISPEHLAAGTRVDQVQVHRDGGACRLLLYLRKYLVKGAQKRRLDVETGEILASGRMWGVWGEVPAVVLARFEFDWPEVVQLLRRVRRWGCQSRYLARVTARGSGLLVLGDGERVGQLLRGLPAARSAS